MGPPIAPFADIAGLGPGLLRPGAQLARQGETPPGSHADRRNGLGQTRIRTSTQAPAAPAVNANPSDESGQIIPNHFIVVLEDSVSHPGAVADRQAEEVDAEVGLVYRAGLKGYSATMSKADAAALRQDPDVRYVVPDRVVSVAAQAMPAGVERIGAPKNSSLAIDAKQNVEVNADIGIIDTGIDYEHPDLNVVARTNCVPPGESIETEY